MEIEHLLNFFVVFITTKSIVGSTDLAQNLVSVFHNLYILYYGIGADITTLDYLVSFSMAYFTVDSVIILANVKKYWYYWIHHAIAIYLGGVVKYGYIPYQIVAPYMYTLELSNLFLVPWILTRKRAVIYLLAATYIPIRTLALPYYSYRVSESIIADDARAIIARAFCAFIQLFSWGFSIKIGRIAISKWRARAA